MRAVKPYYVSGYKKRVFDRFSKVIDAIFSYRGSYKILPFLPVVLYVFYPLFFSVNLSRPLSDYLDPPTLQYIISLIPLMLIIFVSLIWWGLCIENFNIMDLIMWLNVFEVNPIKVYKEEGLFSSIFAFIFAFGACVFLVAATLGFCFVGAGLVDVIGALLMLVFKNEMISFYVVTLPLVLGLSYVVLR